MFNMWDWSSGMGWWMGFGAIWMILLWGGITALIIWGIRKITDGNRKSRNYDPLDTARERYARGDITKEEFEQIRKTLS